MYLFQILIRKHVYFYEPVPSSFDFCFWLAQAVIIECIPPKIQNSTRIHQYGSNTLPPTIIVMRLACIYLVAPLEGILPGRVDVYHGSSLTAGG